MSELSRLVLKVYSKLDSNPFSLSAYRTLLKYATQHNLTNSLEVVKVRSRFEATTPEFIDLWLAAIEKEDPASQESEKAALWAQVSAEMPTSQHILMAMEHDAVDLNSAYSRCKDDFESSQSVFKKIVQFHTSQEDWLTVKALYDARLKTPHKQLQQTFENLSAIVSAHFSEQYTELMRAASKQLRLTEKSQRYYELIEQDLAQDPFDPQKWISYMDSVSKYAEKSGYPSFLAIFFRSLYVGEGKMLNEDWIPVWTRAIGLCSKYPNFANKSLLFSFLKAFPQNPQPYTELVYTVDPTEFHNFRNRIEESNILTTENVQLAKDIIIAHTTTNDLAWTVSDIKNLSEQFHSHLPVLEVAVSVLLSKKAFDDTISLLQRLCTLNRHNAEFLAFAVGKFSALGCQNDISTLIQNWESEIPSYDDPTAAFETMFPFILIQSSDKTGTRFSLSVLKEKILSEKTDVEEDVEMEEQELTPPPKKSKSTPAESEEPVRSREQFRVKIYPVSETVTEDSIRSFLQGYAEPRSISISNDFALVELSSERDVLSCLTRDKKTLDSQTVNVTRVFGNTVWLTNYPAQYGQNEISELVLKITGLSPVSLRLPSQSDNRERRFCYIDFQDSESALQARNKLEGYTSEGLELKAEISNPSLKRHRPVAPVSHQIRLHNMNFKETTEPTLREFFSRFGDIESINVPLSDANKSKGYVNNGYAFVTYTTETAVKQALELQGAQIDGRRVAISSVVAKTDRNFDHVREKHAGHFGEQQSVTVHNVDERVTKEQLQVFLEEKVGPITRLQLKPSRHMALVEFESVAVAGKAGFVLEGSDYEGQILKVGPKSDFFKEEAKPVPMMMSMLMRRKRR